MLSNHTSIRVRYAETDQMGYVYYGNYAMYYEVARVELIRSFGISYKDIEDSGIMMPVLDLKTKYIRPARYDELLTVHVYVKEKPTTRMRFEYEIFNESKELINVGETTLVFVKMETQRPCAAPELMNSVTDRFF